MDKVKPVTVRIEEFQADLNAAVSKSGLPAYLLEILLSQYLMGVNKVAKEEYAQFRTEWEAEKHG